MTASYRIFDTAFSCDFPLPGMPVATAVVPLFAVQMAAGRQFDSSGYDRRFTWTSAAGQAVCWCERRAEEYLLVFPGFASYHVADGVISCLLQPGADLQMLQHLLLSQVIPRFLASHGHLVLHASAVTLESGCTVAFLGNSGFGKSTLAASFHRHGARLVNDDCIMLIAVEGGVGAIGGFPGIRLFPDSMHAVFSETAGFSVFTPYSDKQQMVLKQEVGGPAPTPRVLDALFLLADPQADGLPPTVQIEPVSGSHAMMGMIGCAFCLDPEDKQLIARSFYQIGAAITARLGLYSLAYPRDHAHLAVVREAVEGCVWSSWGRESGDFPDSGSRPE